ncbi:MAG: replication factor C small subunit [Candidatus Bathyarchaeia archaeon]
MVLGYELWTEKYRPRTLDEIIDQDEIVARLKSFVKAKNVPHCIFAGPPGTGKTTAALCLAHDLYGENYREYIMELNASDERGINVIRETVKTFARTKPIGEVTFKLLILDEADNMTDDAQQALRRTMERYSETARFILIANYSGKIIEPIQSRCAPFRFTYLPADAVAKRIRHICDKEDVEITDDGVEAILELSGGDLRKTLNILQTAASIGKPVTADLVYAVVGKANPADIRDMMLTALNGDFIAARNKLRELTRRYGLAGTDIIRQIHGEVFRLNIPDSWKVKLTDIIGEVDYRLVRGATEEIQLSALLARLVEAGYEMKKSLK